ncbi:MAG: NADH-quinone oxidoreductase subunit NuoK [Deltaproteobacteria bacterium]|nr:NADH-quinone oxidoreductase subunit NuoK [Deltaproteobacteria bacterium]
MTHYLILSALLFSVGVVGVLCRRNALVIFMSVELMLNAANLVFLTFARFQGNLHGQVAAFFVMVVAAAEVAVGLAILVKVFKDRETVDLNEISFMKG